MLLKDQRQRTVNVAKRSTAMCSERCEKINGNAQWTWMLQCFISLIPMPSYQPCFISFLHFITYPSSPFFLLHLIFSCLVYSPLSVRCSIQLDIYTKNATLKNWILFEERLIFCRKQIRPTKWLVLVLPKLVHFYMFSKFLGFGIDSSAEKNIKDILHALFCGGSGDDGGDVLWRLWWRDLVRSSNGV